MDKATLLNQLINALKKAPPKGDKVNRIFNGIEDFSFVIDEPTLKNFMAIANEGIDFLSPVYAKAYRRNVEITENQGKLEPGEISLESLKTSNNIQLLDPRHLLRYWSFECNMELEEFLLTEDPDTQKSYGELILDQAFPEKAGDVDFYLEALADLHSGMLTALVQSLTTKFLEDKYPDIYKSEDKNEWVDEERIIDSEIYSQYLPGSMSALFQKIPFNRHEKISSYSAKTHLTQPSVKKTSDTEQIIDEFLRGFELQLKPGKMDREEWVNRQIKRFYQYLYELEGDKFRIQNLVDKTHHKPHHMRLHQFYNIKEIPFRRLIVRQFIQKRITGVDAEVFMRKHDQKFEEACLDIKREEHSKFKKELLKLYTNLMKNRPIRQINKHYGFVKTAGEVILRHVSIFYQKPRLHSPAEIQDFRKFCDNIVQKESERMVELNLPEKMLSQILPKLKEVVAFFKRLFSPSKNEEKKVWNNKHFQESDQNPGAANVPSQTISPGGN